MKEENSKAKSVVQKLFDSAGIKINGDGLSDVQVYNPRFYKRVIVDGLLGIGESFMDGDWNAQRLDLTAYMVCSAGLDRTGIKSWRNLIDAAEIRLINLQTRKRSKKVGHTHYDIGNGLYELMLDKYMTYSCAYWKQTKVTPEGAKNLDEAQIAKLDLICRKLGFRKGDRILDVGCGWGSLLKYAAAKYQINGVGITISKKQAELALKKCMGLPVEIRFQDYRDVDEKFDHIVSVGMFEHVGPRNYRKYMQAINKNLKDEGLFLLHTIGQHTSQIRNDPWLNKYIFPNSQAPSIKQITKAAEGLFLLEDFHSFGLEYAPTLKAWYDNFISNWDNIKNMKNEKGELLYDERFRRMWEYYLLTGQGFCMSQKASVWQIIWSKNGVKGGYQSLRY
jgi:cyclopropane-fatty-acyl-phospholipid synthase